MKLPHSQRRTWLAAALASSFACSRPAPGEWEALKSDVRGRYPEVSHVTIDTLRTWIAQGEDVLLIDARAPAEFAVSHLWGAVNAAALDEAQLHLDQLPRATRVVVYCSLGYRSGELAKRLGPTGEHSVHNLEGSIFEWANRGFPLFRGTERVERVHPYNNEWSRWLNQERVATNH